MGQTDVLPKMVLTKAGFLAYRSVDSSAALCHLHFHANPCAKCRAIRLHSLKFQSDPVVFMPGTGEERTPW